MFLSDEQQLPELRAGFSDENKVNYCLFDVSGDEEHYYERLIRFAREGEQPRSEKLFVYKDYERDRGKITYGYDMTVAYCEFFSNGRVPDSRHYTTKPVFCILTDKELTIESLRDLDSIEFV